MPMNLRFALSCTLLLLASCAHREAIPVDLLIGNVTVIDLHDGRLLDDRHIAVRDQRIVAVTDDREAARFRATRTIDAGGRYAIPGLWDMHVHFGGGEALIDENRDLALCSGEDGSSR